MRYLMNKHEYLALSERVCERVLLVAQSDAVCCRGNQ